MKKIYYSLIFSFALLIVYLFVLNLLNAPISDYSEQQIASGQDSSTGVNLGVNDKVTIAIQRDRWYGTINEFYDDGARRELYLFGIIKLPLSNNGYNFTYIHVAFLVLFVFINLIILTLHLIDLKYGTEKTQNQMQ